MMCVRGCGPGPQMMDVGVVSPFFSQKHFTDIIIVTARPGQVVAVGKCVALLLLPHVCTRLGG